MLDLSRKTRALLDKAGLPEVQIFASGGLDEFEVDDLVRAGAPIDAFGVGTKVGVSADAPWTDCAYKLVEYASRQVLKLSTKKQTLPGPKQVFRHRGPGGDYVRDLIARAEESPPTEAEALLSEVLREGKRLSPTVTLEELRRRFQERFSHLPRRHKAIRSPEPYNARISQELDKLRQKVAQETQRREISPNGKGTSPLS
jgi:nicotinate phosphoribosyltransferase